MRAGIRRGNGTHLHRMHEGPWTYDARILVRSVGSQHYVVSGRSSIGAPFKAARPIAWSRARLTSAESTLLARARPRFTDVFRRGTATSGWKALSITVVAAAKLQRPVEVVSKPWGELPACPSECKSRFPGQAGSLPHEPCGPLETTSN